MRPGDLVLAEVWDNGYVDPVMYSKSRLINKGTYGVVLERRVAQRLSDSSWFRVLLSDTGRCAWLHCWSGDYDVRSRRVVHRRRVHGFSGSEVGLMAISKSTMRRLEIQQAHKQPKVPAFPERVRATAATLEELVTTGANQGQRSAAYALLTRLSVFWAQSEPVGGREWLFNDMLAQMIVLFPDAEGLP